MSKKSTDEKPKNPHQTIKKEQTLLRHNLTDKEVRDLSETLAQHIEQKKTLEDEKKAVTADYSAKIKEKEALISGLSSRISSGFEMRPTMCLVLIDRAIGKKLYYSKDADAENLKEEDLLKDEDLPAGYQLDLEDKVIEANETNDPGLDVAVPEEDAKVLGDDLAAVKDGSTEKAEKFIDEVSSTVSNAIKETLAFPSQGEDGLLDFQRWEDVTENEFDHESEPDSSGKGLQLWLLWLQYLIFQANDIIGKNALEVTPPVEYLKDFNKAALNRCRNWALNYIRTGGVTDGEGHRLPGPPDFLVDYEVSLMKPKTKEEKLIEETRTLAFTVWHLLPKKTFIRDDDFRFAHLTKGSLEKLRDWCDKAKDRENGHFATSDAEINLPDFPRLRRRSNIETAEETKA